MEVLIKYLKLTISVPKSQRTVSSDKVSPLFREPHIHTGYRLPYKPWPYYLCSLLQVHNESFNIWSHFIALWIFLYKIAEYSFEMDYVHDSTTWPFLVFAIGTLSYAALSTLAHWLQSQSEYANYLCFQMDYIGIGLNWLGSACAVYFYAAPKRFYDHIGEMYLQGVAVVAISICILLSFSKLKYPKPYPPVKKIVILCTMFISCSYGYAPMFYLIYECYLDASWERFWEFVFPHINYTFYFILSGIFFSAHIPERFFPGKVDIVGHGHQIFHVLMAYTSYLQYLTVFSDYKRRPHHLLAIANPNFNNTFFLPVVVVVADLLFILIFSYSYRVRRATEEHAKFQSNSKSE